MWNNNSLVEIFETALSVSTTVEGHWDIWTEEEQELITENQVYEKGHSNEQDIHSRLEEIEDVVYHLKKRLARIEARDGTIFLSLDSITTKLANLTQLIVLNTIQ